MSIYRERIDCVPGTKWHVYDGLPRVGQLCRCKEITFGVHDDVLDPEVTP